MPPCAPGTCDGDRCSLHGGRRARDGRCRRSCSRPWSAAARAGRRGPRGAACSGVPKVRCDTNALPYGIPSSSSRPHVPDDQRASCGLTTILSDPSPRRRAPRRPWRPCSPHTTRKGARGAAPDSSRTQRAFGSRVEALFACRRSHPPAARRSQSTHGSPRPGGRCPRRTSTLAPTPAAPVHLAALWAPAPGVPAGRGQPAPTSSLGPGCRRVSKPCRACGHAPRRACRPGCPGRRPPHGSDSAGKAPRVKSRWPP